MAKKKEVLPIQNLLTVEYNFANIQDDLENESVEYGVKLNGVIKDRLPEELKAEFDEHMGKVLDVMTIGLRSFIIKSIEDEVARVKAERENVTPM